MKRHKEIRGAFKFEVRSVDEKEGIVEGYAAVFNSLVPAYNEKVMPGAFKKTLGNQSTGHSVFYMHNPNHWIGVGLEAKEEKRGLAITAQLHMDVQRARETFALLQLSHENKAPAGLSIGFIPHEEDTDQKGTRLLKELALIEYSITPPLFQASPKAKIKKTRIADMAAEIRNLSNDDFEAFLSTVRREDIEGTAIDDLEPGMAHSLSASLEALLLNLRSK